MAAGTVAPSRVGVNWGWLSTAGIIAAVFLLFGPLFLPSIVLPLWVLAASIALIRRGEPEMEARRV